MNTVRNSKDKYQVIELKNTVLKNLLEGFNTDELKQKKGLVNLRKQHGAHLTEQQKEKKNKVKIA